ncbi:MAG: amino acid adenylation domain-containing protein, partial [Bacteroidales bacterium]
MDLSIIDILDNATSKFADKQAVKTDADSFSYREFQIVTRNFAKQLFVSGCGNEQLIGVYLERSFEMVLGIFGILRIGCTYVSADPNNPLKRTSLLYKNLNIKYVVTSQQLKTEIEEMGFVAIVPVLDLKTSSLGIDNSVSPKASAYILFTSGSTGEPKGVEVSHNSVVNLVTYIQNRYPLLEGNKVLLKSPYTFDGSVWELFGWILMGGTLFICKPGDEKNPNSLARLIEKEQINFLFFVPSMLSAFTDYVDTLKDSINLSSLKWVSVGGEVLTPTLVKHFYKALNNPKVRLINVYGPTETTVYATTYLCDPSVEYAKLPIGEVVTGDYIYILDADLKQVAPGQEGEICIGGLGVAKGYFNSELYTTEKFIADPVTGVGKIYRTGDIGKQLPNGLYDFIGRKDFQVKLRGQRIELGEIENALQQIEEILECAVLFAKDRNSDDSLIAYIRIEPGDKPQVSGFQIADPKYGDYLRTKLLEFIPKYMVPSEIILCDRFPLNQNGKIDRSALPLISSLIDLTAKVGFQPQNNDEQTIYSIWKRILARDIIAEEEDFFQAGGHSLKAIQVITEIIKSFNIEIPLSLFYKKLTLPILCKYIAENIHSTQMVHDYQEKTKSNTNSFDLTPVQTEMWVMNSYDPTGLTHNIQIEFTVEGKVEIDLFLDAFKQTIHSEDSFRSIFPFNGEEPVQNVLESIDFEIPFCDLSTLNTLQKSEKYAEIVHDNGHVLFDFNKLPLFSLHLVKWENDSFRLLMAIHHIIFDGWSLSLFMQRVLLRYNGKEPQKSIFSNGDYSHWLKGHYDEFGYDKEFSYWEKALQHIPNRLTLPTKPGADFSKAGMYGRRHWWSLTEKLTSGIDAFALSKNTTPFVVLMSAFQIVLAKHSGQHEIVVGTPFANRQHPMTGELIGYYTNMVSIHSAIRDNDTYADFIARCNDTSIGSFSNAMLPFGELVKRLGLKFEPGAYPIYQAIFVLQNWPHQPSENEKFRFTQREIGNETSKMDLLLNVEKRESTYDCWLEFDTQLFDEQFVAILADDIRDTLLRIVSLPENSILKEINTLQHSINKRLADTCLLIGEGSLAVFCAELLFQQGFSIRKIISNDDQLRKFAQKHKMQSETEISNKIDFEQVDYLFSINNGYILTPEILEKVTKRAINYHDSPLPKYAGMYATNQAILKGETNHGVSWHAITSQIDSGDILASAKVDVFETDTAYTLNMRCYEAAMNSFGLLLGDIGKGNVQPKIQDIKQRSFFALSNRPTGFGIIDWQNSVNDIGRLLRACDFGMHSDNAFLLPSVWVDNKFYTLLKSTILVHKNTKPGYVSLINNSIGIGCTDGFLCIEKLSDQTGKDITPTEILFPGQVLARPNPNVIEQIVSCYKKWAKFEPFWVKQFQQSDYLKLPILPSEHDIENELFTVEDIDFQWIAAQKEGRSTTLEALVAYYFLRLSRKNQGTFAYSDTSESDEMPFGKWKPLNVVIAGNQSFGETISKISSCIAELKSHGNYLSNILDRFPTLTQLKGKTPFIFIMKEGAKINFDAAGFSLIQVNDRSIRLKGVNPSIAKTLKSFIGIAGQYLDVQNCKMPLMDETIERNIRFFQNLEVCKPAHIEDVVSAFDSISTKFPERIAIFDSGKYYSFSHFNQEVGEFAALLQAHGIGHNAVVAISLGRCYEYFLSVMAILHCGSMFLPLDPGLPFERRKFMLEDSEAKLLIYSGNTDLSDSDIFGIDLATLDLSKYATSEPSIFDETTLAYIMYTSGSTGTPKGVKISRKSLASFVGGALGLYRINENDRILQFANLAFDASIEEMFCAFCSGAALYLRNDEMLDPEKLLSFTIEHEITVWDLPTAFWRQLLSFEVYRQQNHLTNLKLVIIGGEATTLSDYTQWKNIGNDRHELFNTYGPT